jgi:hypothetical protein
MYTRGDEVEVASVVISIIRVDVTLSEARRDDISEEDWDIVTRLSVKLAKRSSMLLARSTKVISCGLLSPDAVSPPGWNWTTAGQLYVIGVVD